MVAGCSGRTTGATNITLHGGGRGGPPLSVSAQLNAIGSCAHGCTAFLRWRQVGTSTWTNGPSFNVGKVNNVPWFQTAMGLNPFAQYEYQACGKEASWSDFVCVGPDGTPGTTQKFVSYPGSGDWLAFRYSIGNTGEYPFEHTIDTGNVGSLVKTWSAPVEAPGAPVVANGVAYVASQSPSSATGTLIAYPAECAIRGRACRKPLWTASVPGDVRGATPVAFESYVLIGARQDNPGGAPTGRLYAFDAASGTLEWTGATGGPIEAPPTPGPGEVLVASDDGFLYAFAGCSPAGATCSPLYKSQSPFLSGGGATTSAPAASVFFFIVGSPDGHVYGFNALGGALGWTAVTGAPIRSSPAVANFVVYVGSNDGKLYAITAGRPGGASGGQLLWTGSTGGAITSSPAVNDPNSPTAVYVGSTDGKLYAFSASCDVCTGGGQLLWTGSTGGPIHSSPAVANGVVYVGSDDGKLYAFPASGCGSSTCSPLFTSPAAHPPSSPAVAGGLVYFTGQVSGASRLLAYALP